MYLPQYLAALAASERLMADGCDRVRIGHAGVADVALTCRALGEQARERADQLAQICDDRYPGDAGDLAALPFSGAGTGPLALVRDLCELARLAAFVHTAWELAVQAASALRDRELLSLAQECVDVLQAAAAWIDGKIKAEAAQALLVA